MRKFGEQGKCSRCGKVGPIWQPHLKVLDFGNGTVLEPQAKGTLLCDDCEEIARVQFTRSPDEPA